MRDFRKNVLQEDINYAPILYQYDVIGPEISRKIREDTYDIADKIYDCFLVPIVKLLKKKDYKRAVDRYIFMTNSLKDYYGIDYNREINPSYDYKNGGHGYLKKK